MTPALWSLAGVALFCVAVFGSPLRQELGRTPLHVGLFLPTALLLGTLPAYLTRRLSGRSDGTVARDHLPRIPKGQKGR